MKESIEVLKQAELCGRQFQVYGTLEEPLFKAKDVTDLLGLTNPREVMSRIDEDERRKFNLPRQGATWMLTENGLYEVLMQSRKPIAKEFKKAVKAILKEIRTKGGYMVSRPEETPEQVMARALLIAQDTIDRTRARAEKAESKVILLQSQSKALSRENSELQYQNDYLQSCNDGLQNTVENMRPAAVFAKAVSTSPQSVLMKELAMVISQNKVGVKIGQNRLFQWMRDNGFLCSVKGERYNLPTQKAIDMGLIEVKKSTYTTSDGNTFLTNTPKITGKGQIYFVNRVLYDLINDKVEKGGEA